MITLHLCIEINARQLCINNQGKVVVKNNNKQIKISSILNKILDKATHVDIETHPSI